MIWSICWLLWLCIERPMFPFLIMYKEVQCYCWNISFPHWVLSGSNRPSLHWREHSGHFSLIAFFVARTHVVAKCVKDDIITPIYSFWSDSRIQIKLPKSQTRQTPKIEATFHFLLIKMNFASFYAAQVSKNHNCILTVIAVNI